VDAPELRDQAAGDAGWYMLLPFTETGIA